MGTGAHTPSENLITLSRGKTIEKKVLSGHFPANKEKLIAMRSVQPPEPHR